MEQSQSKSLRHVEEIIFQISQLALQSNKITKKMKAILDFSNISKGRDMGHLKDM